MNRYKDTGNAAGITLNVSYISRSGLYKVGHLPTVYNGILIDMDPGFLDAISQLIFVALQRWGSWKFIQYGQHLTTHFFMASIDIAIAADDIKKGRLRSIIQCALYPSLSGTKTFFARTPYCLGSNGSFYCKTILITVPNDKAWAIFLSYPLLRMIP